MAKSILPQEACVRKTSVQKLLIHRVLHYGCDNVAVAVGSQVSRADYIANTYHPDLNYKVGLHFTASPGLQVQASLPYRTVFLNDKSLGRVFLRDLLEQSSTLGWKSL